MKSWTIIILLLSQFAFAKAQSSRLNLVSSDYGVTNSKTGFMVYYKGVYEHNGNTLLADSSYIYEDEIKRQFFEAFGNVVITQPSGTVIYADKLHYDALAQHAKLTGNVKMVDRSSTLTTNYLTYNMRSKIGTYTGGGRIISQGDTITSKNAYYFETTSDAYFRHNVIVRTPNVKVYTDSMQYNSITKQNYFFGPTNMKGNKGENLYTERGVYNTGTGIADFNQNNLYTEGTKFLKGDSLHYNRESGIGEAFRNVVFVDTLDKFYAYGGKGVYRQDEESILMTEKPLIITVVKNDSNSTETPVDTIDSTETRVSKKTRKELKKEREAPEVQEEAPEEKSLADITYKSEKDSIPEAKLDSVFLTADTLFSQVILVKDYKPLQLNLSRDGGQLITEEEIDYGDDEKSLTDFDSLAVSDLALPEAVLDSTRTEENIDLPIEGPTDTVKVPTDNVKQEVTPAKPVVRAKAPLPKKAPESTIEMSLKADSTLRQQAVMPTGKEADEMIQEALKVAQSPDTVKRAPTLSPLDSTKSISDTAKTRIVKAYYNVRLFKSDLQAVADSTYYGMVDSMFRFMGKPMIWAQGSQISADTIYMQLVNQQLDNTLLKNNAFMVNAVLDSVKFNQMKGRNITAFFTNNNIDRLYVDGNAENISFSVNEKLKIVTEMIHDRGARIKVKMENKEVIDYITIQKVDQKVYPFKMINQDIEILKGFIWRPQDRPTSKEDLLNRKRELDSAAPTPPAQPTEEKVDDTGTVKKENVEVSPKENGSKEELSE